MDHINHSYEREATNVADRTSRDHALRSKHSIHADISKCKEKQSSQKDSANKQQNKQEKRQESE